MALLIDGYNLLNESGVFPARGNGTLHAAREALLQFLAGALDAEVLARTTIVFDAADAPRHLPRQYEFAGIDVRFARDYDEADTLIEELIRSDDAPRQLTVVSSDHRLQKAARRRKARAVDSGPWYLSLERQSRRARRRQPPIVEKPALPSDAEVQRLLDAVGDVPQDAALPPHLRPRSKPAEEPPELADDETAAPDEPPPDDPGKPIEDWQSLANPFPPGYGEDLLDEEEP